MIRSLESKTLLILPHILPLLLDCGPTQLVKGDNGEKRPQSLH